jgi:hypothetical protein
MREGAGIVAAKATLGPEQTREVNSVRSRERGSTNSGYPVRSLRSRKRCHYGLSGLQGEWHGHDVLEWLDGGRRAVVIGWLTPVRRYARAELPPLPGKPTYGTRAKEGARALRAEARRDGIPLSPSVRARLQAVIEGREPLRLALWQDTGRYLIRVKAERERARKPLRFQLGAGGLRMGWRSPGG